MKKGTPRVSLPKSIVEATKESYESPPKRRASHESDKGPSKELHPEKKAVSCTPTEKMETTDQNDCPQISKCVITLTEPVGSDNAACWTKLNDVPRLFTEKMFSKYRISSIDVAKENGVFETKISMVFDQNGKEEELNDSSTSEDVSQTPMKTNAKENPDTNLNVASPEAPVLVAAEPSTDLPEDPKVSFNFQ